MIESEWKNSCGVDTDEKGTRIVCVVAFRLNNNRTNLWDSCWEIEWYFIENSFWQLRNFLHFCTPSCSDFYEFCRLIHFGTHKQKNKKKLCRNRISFVKILKWKMKRKKKFFIWKLRQIFMLWKPDIFCWIDRKVSWVPLDNQCYLNMKWNFA